MAWFKKTRRRIAKAPEAASKVPEGLWVKCPACSQAIYHKELIASQQVCPKSGHHFRMSALERLSLLFDNGTWTEHDSGLRSIDPLNFRGTKVYRDQLEASIKATGLKDAIICATGDLEGLPVVVAAMEY